MKLLFLTSRLPFPPLGGDRVRTFHFLRHLSRRHQITLVSFVEHAEQVQAAARYHDFYERLVPVPLSRSRSYLNCARGLVSSEPLQTHYYRSERMSTVLAREFSGHRYDAAIVHMIRMAPYLDDIPVRRVLDLCDALSLYHRRATAFSRGLGPTPVVHAVEARRLVSYEVAAIDRSDVTLFISPVDAEYLQGPANADRIAIVRNGVDVETFAFHAERTDTNRIVYLGNMRTFQNTDAAVFLAREIFPLIQSRRPDAVLHIAGNDPSKRVRALHDGRHVIVTGRLDSVVPCLAAATLMAAPMRAFAGVQNKILESLAVGTPVVTTSIGAEGLDGGVLSVADSPQEFARAALELMQDSALRRDRALAGRHYVETQCTWDIALEGIDALLSGPTSGRTPPHSIRA